MLFDSYLIILVLFEFKSDPLLFLFLFLTYKIFSPLAVLWQVDRIIKINRTESFFSLVFLVFPIFFLFVLLPLLFNSFFFENLTDPETPYCKLLYSESEFLPKLVRGEEQNVMLFSFLIFCFDSIACSPRFSNGRVIFHPQNKS